MRKTLIVAGCIIALFSAYHFGTRWYLGALWASSFCDKIELASADSPDLRWQAKAIQFGCGDALFGSDDFVAVVVVERNSWWITERDEVLRADSKWRCGAKLEWSDKDVLQLYLPENMFIDRQTIPTANVTVTISVIPVDPGSARESSSCRPAKNLPA